MDRDIPVVILCGGKGTRMGDHTRVIPKPMIKIGNEPILWHIMKIYSHYGFNNFILCLGYKGEKIREHFKDHRGWNIKFVDTGLDTNTGGRIKRIEGYVESELFFATYGDGLSDLDITALLRFHRRRAKIATLAVVRPPLSFGILKFNHQRLVTEFNEKPRLDRWINGGFFVFNKEIFGYIGPNDVLEREVFARLVKTGSLSAYIHNGFWECMDTYKDNLELNNMWRNGRVPWSVWRKQG